METKQRQQAANHKLCKMDPEPRSRANIAMGQSSDEVKRAATHVTTSSEEEGFANAIDRFILGGG